MVVSKCPICQQFLVGFQWTKTAKGKNWLKKGDEWHNCPSKKLKKKTASKNFKLTGYGVSIIPLDFDSNEPGFYCTGCEPGHKLESPVPDKCDQCNKPTGVTLYRP